MARTRESRKKQMLKSWGKYQIGKCRNLTAKTFQKMIRVEAANRGGELECVTCGAIDQWNAGFQMQAGHYVSSRCNAILFEENNVHVQCSRCNVYLHGNQERYSAFMLNKYGPSEVERLQLLRNASRQFTKDELVEMRIDFMDRIKAAEERLR